MKKVSVHTTAYLYGIPYQGPEINLNGRWKTIISQYGFCHLEFEDSEGNWHHEGNLWVNEREEFINECG